MSEKAEEKTVEVPDNFEDIISRSVSEAIDTKSKESEKRIQDSLLNQLMPAAEVGEELTPRWMKDVGTYLNAGIEYRKGNTDVSNRMFKDLEKNRKELTEAQKRYEDKEAIRIIKESGLTRAQQVRAQSTLTGGAGLFLLPKPFLAEMFVRIEEFGAARRLFRGIPMGSKDLDLKSVATKPAVSWVNELAASPDATDIVFAEGKLEAKKMQAFLPWSSEIEEDEVFGLVSLASELFGEAIAEKEDKAGFLGAGSGDTANAEFTGVLNLTGNLTHTIGGDSFDDLKFNDVSIARNKLSLVAMRNARWVMHHSIEGILERIIGLDGQPIYRKPQDARPAFLYGYPVEFVEVMPTAGDEYQEDTPFIAFGNFNNMLFGNRRNVNFDISREGVLVGADDKVVFSAFHQDAAILRVNQRIAFASPLAKSFVTIKTDIS